MRFAHTLGAALAVVCGAALAPTQLAAQAAAYVVVVNEANAVADLSADEIARFFLKRSTRWPGGDAVTAVDQAEGSSGREAFSHDVLRKSVSAVKAYWQTLIFSGQAVPPVELASDEAVISFVRANRGAIGYVSSRAVLGSGVRRVYVVR